MLKKILVYIYMISLIFIIYLVQLFVIDTRSLFGVKPNLILISVIVVSLWFGIYKGTIYSFIIGFVTDMAFGNSYGFFTISYTVVALLIGVITDNYIRDNKLSLVYITLISTALFEIIQYIQYAVIFSSFSNLIYLVKQILMASMLNIVIVYIVYGFMYKTLSYFEESLKVESRMF